MGSTVYRSQVVYPCCRIWYFPQKKMLQSKEKYENHAAISHSMEPCSFLCSLTRVFSCSPSTVGLWVSALCLGRMSEGLLSLIFLPRDRQVESMNIIRHEGRRCTEGMCLAEWATRHHAGWQNKPLFSANCPYPILPYPPGVCLGDKHDITCDFDTSVGSLSRVTPLAVPVPMNILRQKWNLLSPCRYHLVSRLS